MTNMTQPYAGDTGTSPIVATITAAVISCILAAGILVAHFPGPSPIWGSTLWLGIAAVLTIVSVVLISGRKSLARKVFFKVARWVFLYMFVLSGVGEFVLVFDGTRGTPLLVLTLTILLFLINIPMLWGFSVARHEPAS